MKIERLLAFDFGTKYIGVATGQTLTKTAIPLCAVKNKNKIPDWDKIQILIYEYKPTKLLVGIPLNMNGSRQDLTYLCEDFAKELHKRFYLPVLFADERLSTWEAKQTTGLYKKFKLSKKNLEIINSRSAQILLEQWLKDKK